MLQSGLLSIGAGDFTVYRQIVDSFERLDICELHAQFQIEPEKVLFSMVRYRGVHMIGDRRIYGKYKELMDMSAQLRLTDTVDHYWELGKYYTKIVREHKQNGFLEESIQCNGAFYSYSVTYSGAAITMMAMSDTSTSKQLPINFKDYETLELEHTDVVHQEAPYFSLSILKARYDIKHLDECDFVVADTEELANERLERWLNADVPRKGIDTETTGVDIDMYGTDKMVGVILSYKYGEATYFPFGHQKFSNLSEEFLQKKLMPAIKHEDYREVAHNKKFERKVFKHLGWDIRIKYDTMPLSFMVNPVIQRGAHALKDLMYRATGKQFLELENIFTNPKLINFAVLPKEIVRLYACPDASSVIFLYDWLWAQLPVQSRKITEVEFDLADVKADQEYYGLRVDVERFQKNLDNCDYVMKMLLEAFRTITRIDGNINSSEVLTDLIFGKMQCPVLVRTKTGKPSTGAASIKKLASIKRTDQTTGGVTRDIKDLNGKVVVSADKLNKAKYPALVILEQYRIYNKLRTAFYARFERTKKSGRVFFWVNQNGATSGRQSSPMHQLPHELKDIILSDTPEHGMWDPDYSQIELRMIAFLAQEKDLIQLCCDPENDIHRAIGSLISGKEMWEISAEERKIGKRRNFGVVYLISAYGLAGQLFGAGYTEENVRIAQNSLDEFYSRFKRIKKYIAMNGKRVQQEGKIQTYFGRIKYFKEILDPEITSRQRASIIRQSNNMPVQGTAADYMKLAETNIDRYIRNQGWDEIMPNGFPRVRVALSIHDELLIMADNKIPYEEILLMCRTCMEMPVDGAPPFFSAPALVETWAGHDDDSVAIPVNLRDKLIADYQATGVSKFNRENYQPTLDAYREHQLNSYMDGLIRQYGTNADVVADHVRHPSLTHELIARYRPPKGTDMSHVEHIHYAVEQYLKGAEVDTFIPTTKEDMLAEGMQDFTELDKLVTFDSEGNVVYESEEDAIEEDVTTLRDDEKQIFECTLGETIYVWTLLDSLIVDVSTLSKDVANKVIAWLWEYRVPDGFYGVYLNLGENVISARFRVEDIDQIALTDFIKECIADGKVAARGHV